MQTYISHKKVKAAKILGISSLVGGMEFELAGNEIIAVDEKWYKKHSPIHVGGYFVLYKDGYKSYSPSEAFEEGYSPVDSAESVARQEREFREHINNLKSIGDSHELQKISEETLSALLDIERQKSIQDATKGSDEADKLIAARELELTDDYVGDDVTPKFPIGTEVCNISGGPNSFKGKVIAYQAGGTYKVKWNDGLISERMSDNDLVFASRSNLKPLHETLAEHEPSKAELKFKARMEAEKAELRKNNDSLVIGAGDVVRLKSGGTKMTVTHTENSIVKCICYVNGAFHEKDIEVAALEKLAG